MAHKRTGVQTDIRSLLTTELVSAGDMTTFAPGDYGDIPLNRLSIKIKQATKAEAPLTTEMRTIDGEIWVRRANFPALLPGMRHSTKDVLFSLTPWPDDPHYDEKRTALIAASKVTP